MASQKKSRILFSRPRILVGSLITVGLIAVACGTDDGASPAASPQEPPTAAPAAQPAPSATPVESPAEPTVETGFLEDRLAAIDDAMMGDAMMDDMAPPPGMQALEEETPAPAMDPAHIDDSMMDDDMMDDMAPPATIRKTPEPSVTQPAGSASGPPEVGDQFIDFTLPQAGGGEVQLSSVVSEQNVVLVFYRAFW